ncbi:hypothetical protein E2542_SST09217 [Spatholobus suberectus]|nr:hypothetical protein E2542_SST09217 [Spatholobus suberectus]
MSKIRGFNLRKRLIRVSKWIFRNIQIRNRPGYHRLGASTQSPVAKLLTWGRKLTAGAKSFLTVTSWSGYAQLGSEPDPSSAKGAPGRVRGAEGWRAAPCSGAGNILQPPFVWGIAEGDRGGVRVPPPRGNHHPVPVHGV